MTPDPRWLTRFYLMLALGAQRRSADCDRRAAAIAGVLRINIALILLALTLSLRLRGAWRLIGLAVFARNRLLFGAGRAGVCT